MRKISNPDVRESIALLEQSQEITQKQIESTNKSIIDLATNTGSQIRELARTMEKQGGDINRTMEKQGEEFRGEMKVLATEFSASRRTSWPTVIAIAMAIGMLVGAAYKIVDLQTQVTMSPVVAMANVSIAERQQLKLDTVNINNQISDIRAELRHQTARFSEVETQMSKSYDERNIQFSDTQRQIITLQNALHSMGAVIPDAPQYPYFFPSRASISNSSP